VGSGLWGGESGVRRDGGCADIIIDQLPRLQVRTVETCKSFGGVCGVLMSRKKDGGDGWMDGVGYARMILS